MQSGTRLGERYTLQDLLGTGRHGSVWTGHDTVIDRPVTVKVLAGALAEDESVRQRFRQVALDVASLAVPGVVDVHDCLEEPDPDGGTLVCHITERVAGRTLRDILTERGPLPPPEALELLAGVARSLHAAHRAGVVHGNLKPENLIVAADGTVTVVDFGFLPPRRSAYTAPELSADSPAVDVYGLGAIFYECLTGRAPAADGDISPLLDDFDATDAAPIMKALSPQAGHRFATTEAFTDACEHLELVRREHPVRRPAANRAETAAPDGAPEAAAAVETGEPDPTAKPGESEPPPEPGESEAAADVPPPIGPTDAGPADAGTAEPDAPGSAEAEPEPEEPSADDVATVAAIAAASGIDAADPPGEPAEPRLSIRTQALVVIVLIAAIALVSTLVHLATPNEPTGAQPTPEPEYDTSEPESPSASSVTGADRPPNSAEPAPTSSSPSPSDPPTSDDDDDGVPVPYVVGMRVETAQSELAGQGFLVVVSEEGEGRQQCRVHDQSPGGGETVPSGTTVTISVRRVDNPQQCIDPTS